MYDRPSDTGVATGTILGIILALLIVALVLFFAFGDSLGLRSRSTGSNTNITVNPPAGGAGGAGPSGRSPERNDRSWFGAPGVEQ